MSEHTILSIIELGLQWPMFDPFLFCAHHLDAYPAGDQRMRPAASLAGRNLGMDFEERDGWRMYHGHEIPGFPRHPHRGFETITIARQGFIDHSDSLGATARFGSGDVQWMTAGQGIEHAEMFPLVHTDRENPLELFQIWLNLARADKLVKPHFTMLWRDSIPRVKVADDAGKNTQVAVIAGEFEGRRAPPPPPHSWARSDQSDIAILSIAMDPGATIVLPAARAGVNRALYFFAGTGLEIDGQPIPRYRGVRLRPDRSARVHNGDEPANLLLLQARPIGEPVAHQGPFVMNTRAELMRAYRDYQRTRFGDWPWADDAPVHPRDAGRFAVHADGRTEHME